MDELTRAPYMRSAIAISALALAISAQPAHAASAGSDPNGNVHFTADSTDAPNNVTISATSTGFRIRDQGNVIASGSCSGGGTNEVVCDGIHIRIDLGDKDDRLVLNTPATQGVLGGEGNDDITGSQGGETINGGAGSGADGNDVIDGRGGHDVIDGQAGSDVLRGGDGDDTMRGGAADGGADNLDGGTGNDTIEGGPGDDVGLGGHGGDNIAGGGGNDSADGGEDGDSISGGPGADDLAGGGHNDSIRGGDATGVGGDGADTIRGDAGNDSLGGDAGDDSLNGGDGADAMSGGPGNDRGTYERLRAPITVTLDDQPDDGRAGEGDNVGSDVEDVTGGDDENTITGSASANRLEAGGGEDYVDGDAETDTLVTGGSGDTVRSRDGQRDVVQCGDGPDFVIADAQDSVSGECETSDTGNSRPRLGRTMVVEPTAARAQGTILTGLAMQLPRVRRFVPLKDKVGLPVRTVLDSRLRALRLRSLNRRRRTQSAVLSGGTFQMTQSRRTGVTDLSLKGGDFSVCNRRGKDAGSSQRRVIRRLRGRTRGRHRFRGRHSSGVTRGTRWVMEDRCNGTLTRVLSGSVLVRDFAKRRTVLVRRGRSYLARRR
jgi:Ca2+-binding RTX toxin-like protein